MAGALVMFPTPYKVQRIRRTKTGENALGQPIYAETVSTIAVYGWQPTDKTERYTAALAGRTITDLTLLSPTGDFSANDSVVIDGVSYDVDATVVDYNNGPFGFKPGYSIGLRRVADA